MNDYAAKGLMLPRSRNMLYECLREFTVVEEDGRFLGAGGLHIIWEDLAEIRALALVPEAQGEEAGQAAGPDLAGGGPSLHIPRSLP